VIFSEIGEEIIMKNTFRFTFAILLAVCIGQFFNNSVSAASTTLVISQVNGGGGGTTGTYLNDYVEIKNISNAPQLLDGLSLMYGSAAGQFGSSPTNIFTLPTGVTLAPGKYYLVQLGATGTVGAALPVTPDATTTNLSMSGASGKIALTTAAFTGNTCGATATPCSPAQLAAVIDWAAYGAGGNGTAGTGEGGTSINNNVAMTPTQGGVRKAAGCTDTDNNNADFDVVTAPVPRNTTTAAAPCSAVVPTAKAPIDFNGDGKTDYAVTRNIATQRRWFYNLNGSGGTLGFDWGLSTDINTPADFDGDNKTDIAVWRGSNTAAQSAFYILQSATSTVRIDRFGEASRFDNPTIVGDYDGDGKADVAVFATGTLSSSQSFFYYRGSLNNPSGNITYVPFGPGQTLPYPGDFDGDGKFDFCVRDLPVSTTAAATFSLLKSGGGTEVFPWGQSGDSLLSGDYDGDGKTDFTVTRTISGQKTWFILPRTGSPTTFLGWGLPTDSEAVGDYDGDGKADVAVWRAGTFYVRQSTNGALSAFGLGSAGDTAVADFNEQ
jgi:Lamin Tail Domain/FG-GAP-like repeat